MFVRQVKDKKGRIQIQVMEKVNRQNRLVKHIGTAANGLETKTLIDNAQAYLDQVRINQGVVSFFDNRHTQSSLTTLFSQADFLGSLATPLFDFLAYFYTQLGFDELNDDRFKDLVIARIIHPASKAKTLDWLSWKLKRRYALTSVYRTMATANTKGYQEKLERLAVNFVRDRVDPVISILFFDVTTLYYEAFDEDDFRRFGFSKDNKANQPQIVVALTVTREGFPIAVRVFAGNKFEGHTFIPCIKDISEKHLLKDFVVVADSAMISQANMEALETEGLAYIVGARLGNLPRALSDQIIAEVPKTDGACYRYPLSKNKSLVVSYSANRATKDKSDRNKRLRRAVAILRNPTAITNRYKYLKKEQQRWSIHQQAIAKDIQLEGLKGYLTNASHFSNQQIIEKYTNLWQVEQSFRISKSDLKARPIFHTTRDKIEAHITIVFAGLAIAKAVELNTHKTIAKVIDQLNCVEEAQFRDKVSHEVISLYTRVTDEETKTLLKLARLTWVT